MNFTDNLNTLAEKAGQLAYTSDPDFLTELPRFIDAGEQRICRDLDLLSTRVDDSSGSLSEGRRKFVLPTAIGTFIVVESIRIMIGSVTQPPLIWLSRDALDFTYPNEGAVGAQSIPRYVAPNDQLSVIVGPAPSQSHPVKAYGTQRPQPLYNGATIAAGTVTIAPGSVAANGSFISTQLPDLFIAAEMIEVSAWMRNFGAMGGEGDQAVSWTARYDSLITPALIEEARKKLQSPGGWGPRQPSPQARPPQT